MKEKIIFSASFDFATFLDVARKIDVVTPRRTSVPILAFATFECAGPRDIISISGGDFDNSITLYAPCKLHKRSKNPFGLNLKQIYNSVVRLRKVAQMVKIDIDSNYLAKIEIGDFTFTTIAKPDPYQDWKKDFSLNIDHQLFSFKKHEFFGMLNNLQLAISDEATRYYLNGICIAKNGAAVDCVATDGHKLALQNNVVTVSDNWQTVILVKQYLQILKIFKAGKNELISGLIQNGRAYLTFSDALVVGKIVDGVYPSYQKVIPYEPDQHFECDAAQIQFSSKLLNAVSTPSALCMIQVAGQSLNLASKNEFEEAINLQTKINVEYSGPELTFALNASYLAKIVNKLTGVTKFAFNEQTVSTAPILITGANPDLRYVLMPMRG